MATKSYTHIHVDCSLVPSEEVSKVWAVGIINTNCVCTSEEDLQNRGHKIITAPNSLPPVRSLSLDEGNYGKCSFGGMFGLQYDLYIDTGNSCTPGAGDCDGPMQRREWNELLNDGDPGWYGKSEWEIPDLENSGAFFNAFRTCFLDHFDGTVSDTDFEDCMDAHWGSVILAPQKEKVLNTLSDAIFLAGTHKSIYSRLKASYFENLMGSCKGVRDTLENTIRQ
jgi:hypothetical protein